MRSMLGQGANMADVSDSVALAVVVKNDPKIMLDISDCGHLTNTKRSQTYLGL